MVVAIFTVVIAIVGLVSPDSVTAVRRMYFAAPATLYAAAALRVAMGLVVMLAAPASRAPRMMGAMGAVMCLQGLTAIFLGHDRAGAVLEWESVQAAALLRAGAAVALASGIFMAFAVTGRRPARPG